MKRTIPTTALFLDLGGILLTKRIGSSCPRTGSDTRTLDLAEMEDRHHLTSDTYEEGKFTLEEFLGRVDFFKSGRSAELNFGS